MFTQNPFSALSEIISPTIMQYYVLAMFVLVVVGTLLDTLHKQSAKYFFANSKKAKEMATRNVGGGEKLSIAVKTVAADVVTSAEFCNADRRIAHLLTMYGFLLFIVTTAMMVFYYPHRYSRLPTFYRFCGMWARRCYAWAVTGSGSSFALMWQPRAIPGTVLYALICSYCRCWRWRHSA